MSTPTPEAPLSPHWAFVVQLREGTALTPEALHGRVEHIITGQATEFGSLGALLAFMAQVLMSSSRAPCGEDGARGNVNACRRLSATSNPGQEPPP